MSSFPPARFLSIVALGAAVTVAGCNYFQGENTWLVVATLLEGYENAPGNELDHLFEAQAFLDVAECEGGGASADPNVTEVGIYEFGFCSADRGPFQINPIHFWHDGIDSLRVAVEIWRAEYLRIFGSTCSTDPSVQVFENRPKVYDENLLDAYGWGYRWGEMRDVQLNAQFAMLLALRSQASTTLGGPTNNLQPWFKSLNCHHRRATTSPLPSRISFYDARIGKTRNYEIQGTRVKRIADN